jgi:PAS domain S-box-containing protein
MDPTDSFPSNAKQTIQMLARYCEACVVLSIRRAGTLEYLMASPGGSLSKTREGHLRNMVQMHNPTCRPGKEWLEVPEEVLGNGFLKGQYAWVKHRSVEESFFLWLFYTTEIPSDPLRLVLVEQSRQALEIRYQPFFLEPGLFKDSNKEEQLKLLFEFSPGSVFFYNASLEITGFNDRLAEVLQTGRKQLLHLKLRDIRDKRIVPALEAPLKGKHGLYEGSYQSTLSGITLNLLLRTAPVYDDRQQLVGMIGMVLDNTEKEKARQALLESEERLRLLINSTPDVICFKDGEDHWLVANEAWLRLFDVQGKSFIGKNGTELKKLFPAMKEGFEKDILSDRKAWALKKSIKEEKTFSLSDGSQKVLEVVKVPLFFEDESRRGLVVLGRDITDRKRMEDLLRENEERFRLIAIQSNDIIFEWDPVTNLLHWYGDFSAITGAQNNPLNLNEFIKMIHPDDRLRVVSSWEKNYKEGINWQEEFRLILNDGKECFLKGSGIVIFKKGLLLKTFGTLSNITREKLLIRNLQEAMQMAEKNHEQVKGLLKAIPDMFFMIDKEGIIREYHAKSSVRLYVSPSRFLNHKVDDALPAPIASLTHKKMAEVFAHGGIETYNYSLEIGGKKQDFESRMVYVDQNHVLAIVRDVTRALAVEKELIEAKERAEESDRLKSAFLANMSHEIRTPMNGILGFSELLRAPDLSKEDQQNFTDVILRSGHQLLRIINDVMEVSRLETGQVKVLSDRVNLINMMDDLSRFFKISAEKKKIHLEMQVPGEEFFCVLDGGKLTQIFNNLIHNALKFTAPHGQVKFGFEVKEKDVLFFVRDNGIGIDQAHHKMIFDRFMQVSKTGLGNMGGTGLGLSICKSLVDLMGGRLWLESEAKKGAQFFFTVPIR